MVCRRRGDSYRVVGRSAETKRDGRPIIAEAHAKISSGVRSRACVVAGLQRGRLQEPSGIREWTLFRQSD